MHAKLSFAALGAGQNRHDRFGGHGLGRAASGQGQKVDGRAGVFKREKNAVVGKGNGKIVLQRPAHAFGREGKGPAEVHARLLQKGLNHQ